MTSGVMGKVTMKSSPASVLKNAHRYLVMAAMRTPFRDHATKVAVSKVRSSIPKLSSVNDMLDFVVEPLCTGISISPLQIREEIASFLEILLSHPPRYVLEIGTATGGTLFLFAQVASRDATIVSVDMSGGPYGGGYPEWKIPLYRSFARFPEQRIGLLREDSHNLQTVEKVRNLLENNRLDFLFIDGDHTYVGVKKDFEMYSPLVRKGGMIALHDIVPHPPSTRCEVDRLWNEIKRDHEYTEIVNDWNQEWGGIGVLGA